MGDAGAFLFAKLSENGLGEYFIYYEEELLDALPDGECGKDVLLRALKELEAEGYIAVRYARGNAYCISALKKYEPLEESAPDVQLNETPATPSADKRKYAFMIALAFAGSLIGAFAGAFAGAMI